MTTQNPSISTVDAVGRELSPADIKRLQKPVHKTRYKPSNEQVENALKGWRPPLNYAYILFERWRIEIVAEGDKAITYGTFVMDVEGRPEQISKVEFYVRKGFRILDWGNFHYLSDANKESAKKAAMYNNAWATLEEDLKRIAESTDIRAENESLKSENDALLAKISEYESKLSKGKRGE